MCFWFALFSCTYEGLPVFRPMKVFFQNFRFHFYLFIVDHFSFQVCPNGLLRFDGSSYQWLPRNFGTYLFQQRDSCLAPYWSLVDIFSFFYGSSRVYYTIVNDRNDQLFSLASDYGKKIFRVSTYQTLWVVVIRWQDVRPNNPRSFSGVSTVITHVVLLIYKLSLSCYNCSYNSWRFSLDCATNVITIKY